MSKPAFERFKRGEPLSRKQAMGAQCYECNGYSVEKVDDLRCKTLRPIPVVNLGQKTQSRPFKTSAIAVEEKIVGRSQAQKRGRT